MSGFRLRRITLLEVSGMLEMTVGAHDVSEASNRPTDGMKFDRIKLFSEARIISSGRPRSPEDEFLAENEISINTRDRKTVRTRTPILRRVDLTFLSKITVITKGIIKTIREPLPA
jgi:hypothetical protein